MKRAKSFLNILVFLGCTKYQYHKTSVTRKVHAIYYESESIVVGRVDDMCQQLWSCFTASVGKRMQTETLAMSGTSQ